MASSVNMFSANAKTDAELSTGKKTNEAMLKLYPRLCEE
jgi:hypothetical protein